MSTDEQVLGIEPPPVDGVTQPWWDATRERRLLVQRCDACGHHQHYPRALCVSCRSTDLGWTEAAGTAVVHSFTVVHRAPSPAHEAPYVIAVVRLGEGPRMLTRIVGVELAGADGIVDDEPVACDDPVTLDWLALSDGRALPVFRPAA